MALCVIADSAGPKRVRLQEEGEADERRGCGIQTGQEAAASH